VAPPAGLLLNPRDRRKEGLRQRRLSSAGLAPIYLTTNLIILLYHDPRAPGVARPPPSARALEVFHLDQAEVEQLAEAPPVEAGLLLEDLQELRRVFRPARILHW